MTQKNRAAERYSQALIDLSIEARLAQKVGSELDAFLHFLEKNEEMKKVLIKDVFNYHQKRLVIEELCRKVTVSQLTKNFLIYLASQNRFRIFSDICKSFHQKLNEMEGRSFAEISTAIEISQDFKKELQKKFEPLIGKKMELTYTTDPSLIGGVVTKIGNRVFDGSIKTQLQSLKRHLERGV